MKLISGFYNRLFYLAVLSLLVLGCTAEGLQKENSISGIPNPQGAAKQLSTSSYNSLSAVDQYQVTNKLLGTLYKGVSVGEFFNTRAGLSQSGIQARQTFNLSSIAKQLNTRLENPQSYIVEMKEKHHFYNNSTENPAVAGPMALMFELPVSKDHFENWMAYELANTILFSPAEEIASASFDDVDWVYNRLVDWIRKGRSISDIAYSYMVSEANWRRFRSPEDNTREMIEIFLGLFDRDVEIPNVARACGNWWIDEEGGDYVLKVDVNRQNQQPELIFGKYDEYGNHIAGTGLYVVSCEEFYQAVASHPLLVPRITTVLVDRFFANKPQTERAELIQSIMSIQPTTFNEIFLSILFSDEYLINNSRPKSYEETFYNLAARLKWQPHDRFFTRLTSTRSDANKTLKRMGQPSMSLKLGRFKEQPLDSLSFAHYHKAIREDLLITVEGYSSWGWGWKNEIKDNMLVLNSLDEKIDLAFMSVLGRRASVEEKQSLMPLLSNKSPEALATIVFDYASRLPELYYINKTSKGE